MLLSLNHGVKNSATHGDQWKRPVAAFHRMQRAKILRNAATLCDTVRFNGNQALDSSSCMFRNHYRLNSSFVLILLSKYIIADASGSYKIANLRSINKVKRAVKVTDYCVHLNKLLLGTSLYLSDLVRR